MSQFPRRNQIITTIYKKFQFHSQICHTLYGKMSGTAWLVVTRQFIAVKMPVGNPVFTLPMTYFPSLYYQPDDTVSRVN